ncbi:3'-5' exoribonuclease [Methylorubrum sp. B1-46]|uniref:3'-5' exonuclease n=1 Tax=Methylorubrum sp. B1-46 TaxID=2897334 RepID=UPI001E3FD8F5|nr:3'-5' exonuclease [Methylorubrum sp. B1-46]UGB26378.1 3'-5' exoribonuclease [Methylorubrum sp. B1-46]
MAQDTHAVTHVMVDIETLGTAPGSAILSIGAVAFDPFTELLGVCFEANINLADAVDRGLTIDPQTVIWWAGQGQDAIASTFLKSDAQPLASVLADLGTWLRGCGAEVRIWAHGASFDPVLIEAACKKCGVPAPWKFRDLRDTRTIFDLAGISSLAEYRCANDVHHSALSDAKVQARAVGDAYRLLGLGKSEVAA